MHKDLTEKDILIQKELVDLIKQSGALWSAKLNNLKRFSYIKDHILEMTKEFPDIPFPTRVYFFLSNNYEIAKCEVCGKELPNRKCNPLSGFGENIVCSRSCAQKHPNIIAKRKASNLKHFGVEHPAQSIEFKNRMKDIALHRTNEKRNEITNKRKNTCLEKYGVETVSQSKEIQDKIKETKLSLYCDPNYNNLNKIKETNLKKYGVEFASQSEIAKQKAKETIKNKSDVEWNNISEKRQQTMLDKYGEKFYTRTKEYLEKIHNTYLKNRGVTHHMKTQESKDAFKNHLKEKYGVEYFSQVPEIREKIDKKFIEKYGGKSPMCNYEIRKKAKRKYLYEGIYFDSEPEVAYYIWLVDNGINFEYHPKLMFEYQENGETKRYFPDFLVENEIVEIKANYWWTTASNEKKECIKKYANKILFKQDYQKYIDYIKEKFGDNFLKSLKQYGP